MGSVYFGEKPLRKKVSFVPPTARNSRICPRHIQAGVRAVEAIRRQSFMGED